MNQMHCRSRSQAFVGVSQISCHVLIDDALQALCTSAWRQQNWIKPNLDSFYCLLWWLAFDFGRLCTYMKMACFNLIFLIFFLEAELFYRLSPIEKCIAMFHRKYIMWANGPWNCLFSICCITSLLFVICLSQNIELYFKCAAFYSRYILCNLWTDTHGHYH